MMTNTYDSTTTTSSAPPPFRPPMMVGTGNDHEHWLELAQEAGINDGAMSLPEVQQTVQPPFFVQAKTHYQGGLDNTHKHVASDLQQQAQAIEVATKRLEEYDGREANPQKALTRRRGQSKAAEAGAVVTPIEKEVALAQSDLEQATTKLQENQREAKKLEATVGKHQMKVPSKVGLIILLTLIGLFDLPITFSSLVGLRLSRLEQLMIAVALAGVMAFLSHVVGKLAAKTSRSAVSRWEKAFLWGGCAMLLALAWFLADQRHEYITSRTPEANGSVLSYMLLTLLFVLVGVMASFFYFRHFPAEGKAYQELQKQIGKDQKQLRSVRQRLAHLEGQLASAKANLEQKYGALETQPDEQRLSLVTALDQAILTHNQTLEKVRTYQKAVVANFAAIVELYHGTNLARRPDGRSPQIFGTMPALEIYFQDKAMLHVTNQKLNTMNMKTKKTEESTSPHSNVTKSKSGRTGGLFHTSIVLLMMLLSTVTLAQQNVHQLMLVDISESSQPLAQPPSADFILAQNGLKVDQAGENGGSFTIAQMGDLVHLQHLICEIDQAGSWWSSNEYDRIDAIAEFHRKVERNIAQAMNVPRGTDHSRLFEQMVRYLNQLAAKKGKKYAYIYSDLIEGGNLLGHEDFMEMVSDRSRWGELEGLLEAGGKLNDLSGVTIYLVYQTNCGHVQRDILYGHAKAFYQHYLTQKGARVMYVPSVE